MICGSYIGWLGRVVDLYHLKPSQVSVRDIASTLAKINRYNGRTPYPYSVAQHAVLVARLCPPEFAYEGLHHDDTEAFVGDVIGPVKAWLGWFKYLESERVRPPIAEALGLARQEPPEVKAADLHALRLEQWYIQGREPHPDVFKPEFRFCFPDVMGEMHWKDARDLFLEWHEGLRPRKIERRVGM